MSDSVEGLLETIEAAPEDQGEAANLVFFYKHIQAFLDNAGHSLNEEPRWTVAELRNLHCSLDTKSFPDRNALVLTFLECVGLG